MADNIPTCLWRVSPHPSLAYRPDGCRAPNILFDTGCRSRQTAWGLSGQVLLLRAAWNLGGEPKTSYKKGYNAWQMKLIKKKHLFWLAQKYGTTIYTTITYMCNSRWNWSRSQQSRFAAHCFTKMFVCFIDDLFFHSNPKKLLIATNPPVDKHAGIKKVTSR